MVIIIVSIAVFSFAICSLLFVFTEFPLHFDMPYYLNLCEYTLMCVLLLWFTSPSGYNVITKFSVAWSVSQCYESLGLLVRKPENLEKAARINELIIEKSYLLNEDRSVKEHLFEIL